MQILDFLQKNLSPKAHTLLVYSTDLFRNLGAYLRQIWPVGKILVISEAEQRDNVEQILLPSLQKEGTETLYCLCVRSTGVSYQAQIDESLGDGALENVSGIAAVGSSTLFAAARERAGFLNIACCAVLDDFCPVDAFGEYGEYPCADAIFFDLDRIADKYRGNVKESLQNLELYASAAKIDATIQAHLKPPVHAAIFDALDEPLGIRQLQLNPLTEDALAQLCEGYTWYAVAMRLWGQKTSLQSVVEYNQDSPEFSAYTIAQHSQVLSRILAFALELESLEIDPEDCANHQPPKEILRRTLQQILMEDGLKFDRLTQADQNFEDRLAIKLKLRAAADNWDEICQRLRPLADMVRVFSASDDDFDDDAELDPGLKTLWAHAARFAPSGSFLRLMNDMRLVESSLYD